MISRLLEAIELAKRAHAIQKRKYTGEPYIIHPLEVALLVSSVTDNEDVVIAALLHDTLEDTILPPDGIKDSFGEDVLHMVLEVTDISKPEDGNRRLRKAMERAHLSNASSFGQTIKLADLINNAEDIAIHDPAFARVYLEEISELLPILTKGSPVLHTELNKIIDRVRR